MRFPQTLIIGLTLWFLTTSVTYGASALTLDRLFPKDRILDVQIKIDRETWNNLRYQTRDRNVWQNRGKAPIPSPFTYFIADVTIDGVTFPRVGLRKKGFIGSLDTFRPSLKVKLNYTEKGAHLGGLKTLTFNNNKQDRSLLSQHMSYLIFNRAGSPAPRTAFARVRVNGTNLGIYTHVETVREPLLEREFGTDAGTLYESTVVDFRPGWANGFELKTGNDIPGREGLANLIGSLKTDPGDPIFDPKTPSRAWVPRKADPHNHWTRLDFDDTSWPEGHGAAGYDTQTEFDDLIHPNFDFEDRLHNQQRTLYLRIPFTINDLSEIEKRDGRLQLGVMYDDGFVAYLNGQFIASKNAPYPAKWNSLATDSHADASATSYELFDIHQHKDKLIEGENLLALQGLNLNIVSTDMLIAGVLSTSRGERQIQIWDHVDEDSFYPFWALEGLMASWDGYAGNANNFFIYLHPESKKFHFMPWGTDSLFLLGRSSRRSPATLPTVLKNSVLVDYLWRFPEVREKYAKAVLKILKETWHEDQLIAEINRLEPMLRRSINPQQFDYTRQLQLMRQFIQGRRQQALTDMSLYLQKPSTTKP